MFKAQEIDMEFLGSPWDALGILGPFDFCPHSIIQSGVSPSNRPPPPPPSSSLLRWCLIPMRY